MLYKLTKEQLLKCSEIKFSEHCYEYHIKKCCTIPLEENKCYILELAPFILDPQVSSNIVINWNNNTYPKYAYWKADISKIMGNMVKINAVAYDKENNIDINELWSGWVPKDCINIIERI